MTKSQTYSTRHLTARDHQLIDALERDPRYRKIAEALRPKGPTKPKPQARAEPKPESRPAPEPQRAAAPEPPIQGGAGGPLPPKAQPEQGGVAGSAGSHTVGASSTKDTREDPPLAKPVPKGKDG